MEFEKNNLIIIDGSGGSNILEEFFDVIGVNFLFLTNVRRNISSDKIYKKIFFNKESFDDILMLNLSNMDFIVIESDPIIYYINKIISINLNIPIIFICRMNDYPKLTNVRFHSIYRIYLGPNVGDDSLDLIINDITNNTSISLFEFKKTYSRNKKLNFLFGDDD